MSDIRILPSSIADPRAIAFRHMIGEAIASFETRKLLVTRVGNLPDTALPAFIRQWAVHEFITPDLPIAVQRRIIDNAWQLNAQRGYVSGIKTGVSMLGYKAKVTQWWQQSPRGIPNTHKIEIRLETTLFNGRQVNADIAALVRMIEGMQRWSQDHAIRFIMPVPLALRIGAALRSKLRIRLSTLAPKFKIETFPRFACGLVQRAHIRLPLAISV